MTKTEQAMKMEMNKNNSTKKKMNTWKLGVWNIRSIQGKEIEIINEFEEANVEIMAISETKKKGEGKTYLTNGHILIYSGVQNNQRAAAGVGCIIHRELAGQITKWKAIYERILLIELRNEQGEHTTIISIYGPDENERASEKDKFWEELTTTTEEARGTLYLVGDFNSRVGKKDIEYKTIIGKHGEEKRNNNGRRLLDFCQLQNLIITNTFYQHKEIHKYTREQQNRGEKSIIDYIIVQKEERKNILDVRVKRGAEIYSDHYLVIGKIKQRDKEIGKNGTIKKESQRTIKNYKLRDKDIASRYTQITESKIKAKYENIKQTNIQQGWKTFKEIIIETAKEVCGISKGKGEKRTAWWTNDIKEEVKKKKKEWKKYLTHKTPQQYEKYKKQRIKVKEIVAAAKEKSWIDFGNKMEEDSTGNQKLFYKVLKTLRTNKQPTQEIYIKNKNQEILTNKKDIMERWREYFKELLGHQKQNKEENTNETEIENQRGEEKTEEIKMEELINVIKKLKNGKTPGNDKITTEMIKNLGETGREILLQIINKAWKNEKIPEEWGIALIKPIHKKGDKQTCENYRGITLLNTIVKIYEQIINNRLKIILEPQLAEPQSGFRPGRNTQDHIFTIKQIIEKKQPQNKNIYLAFIDLQKAFDTVPREKVWKGLQEKGINNKIIKVIQDLYKNNTNYIINNNMKSEGFKTEMGLRQGGGLSPTLFNVHMDGIIKKSEQKANKLFIGYRNLQKVEITAGVFADDVVITAGSEKKLQENLKIWKEKMEEEGMEININKTKIMVIGDKDIKINIEINNVKIEQVEEFKYLGVTLEETGKQEAEINERIDKTIKLYYAMNQKFINKKEITKQTKIKVFNTIYRPVLTYGCESWNLSIRQKNKIQAMEMKYLRRVLGVTREDRIRNIQIREELGVKPVTHFIEQRQLSWWGHIQRMNNNRQVKLVYEARPQTKRKRGRPRKTWNQEISRILHERGKTWVEAKNLAKNRKEWKKFIDMK